MTLQSPPSPGKNWSYDKYFQAQMNKNKKETKTNLTNRYKSTDDYQSTPKIRTEN